MRHSFKHIEIRGPIMAIWSLFNTLVLELWKRISRGLGFEPIGVCFRYDLEFFLAWLEIYMQSTLKAVCNRSGRFWQYWNCRAKAKIYYFCGWFFFNFSWAFFKTFLKILYLKSCLISLIREFRCNFIFYPHWLSNGLSNLGIIFDSWSYQ